MNEMPDKQDEPGEPVAFRLFGGVRIVRAGVEVAVRQRKQRAILAVLAASPGEPIDRPGQSKGAF